MIKKTVLCTALLVASALPAMSEQWMSKDWKYLGSVGSTLYYYQPRTLSVTKDNTVMVWSRKELDVDAATIAKDKLTLETYNGNKKSVSYDEYDCVKKKKRAIIGKTYTGSEYDEIRRSDWQDVAPKSVDEAITSVVCQEMKKRKESEKKSE